MNDVINHIRNRSYMSGIDRDKLRVKATAEVFTPTETVIRKMNNPFEKNENGNINVLPTMYRMDFFSKSIDKQY